jgi:pimeloyl-ACP methyl ester carboxylesterase
MSTQYITTRDGVRIAYDVSGDGPALMLLHGAGKTRRDWKKVGYVERLQNEFAVINVDIRGSGESEVLTRIEDYGIEKIVNDLMEVKDQCEVQQMMVLGYSLAGNIARYLGTWSDRVQAIAVIRVPFGKAVNKEFNSYIDVFIEKCGTLAQAYITNTLNEKKRKSAIKGRIPVWVAC